MRSLYHQCITLLLICSCILSGANLDGQSIYPSPEHPEWFKAIPAIDNNTPEWAKVMYSDDSNFEKIQSLKYTYDLTHPYKKTIHIQNYKHWFKVVSNYVNEEGKVELPAPGDVFNASLKKKSSPNKSLTAAWTNIGPYETINFTNGVAEPRPTQANIYSLAVAESNTNIVYASAETGGIYKTTDKGISWTPITRTYDFGNMQDIKVDPTDEDIVYIARGSEMYKTTDGGLTWALIHTFSNVIEQFLIQKSLTSTIYAATRDGVSKSLDSGATWSSIYTGRTYDIEAKPGVDSILYLACENTTLIRPEIKKSTDYGATWSLMDNGYYTPSVPGEATIYGCKIGVTPADPNRIYAGIIASGKAADNGWIGIYYSLDEGATWQNDSGQDGAPYASGNDASTNWYVAGYSSGYHQGFYNFDIDVSHNNPDKLWIGTIWFCESGNKGGNIEYIRGTRDLNMHADIQDIDVVGNEIWVASDGGINFSDDECVTVSTRMNGITASDYWGFGQGWNEDTWVGGRYHNGNAAGHENYGFGKTLFLGGAESATGYVDQFDNKKNYHSDIGGRRIPESFTENAQGIADLGLYPTQAYYHFSYSEVEWDPRYGNRVLLGRDSSIYISQNSGTSFEPLFHFPDKTFGSSTYDAQVRRFEISRDDPNYIYAIIYYSYWNWSVFKSTDGGISFSEITAPSLSGGSWRDLSFGLNPFNKEEIWLASRSSSNGNKIFSSIDGGNSWTNRYTSTIEDVQIKDVIYQANSVSDKVYIMTAFSYFYYDVSSQTWTEWNIGLPAAHKGFISVPFYRDNKIRMASAKGIWESEMEDLAKVQAMPMVSSDSVFCVRDTVRFESYSIAGHIGTSWLWSISPAPTFIDNPNAKNPKVLLDVDGSYDVTLTVTDINGQVDTRTIQNMVTLDNRCVVDSFAGNSLQTFDNGDYLVSPEANLTNLTHFTVTGWWKPNGAQQAYAALFSSGDWCAHCTDTEGLIFNYNGDKLWYKWPGEGNPWGSNSGIDIPLDEWSYVALVIEPNQATMYLNNEKYVHTRVLDPGEIANIYIGYGHYSKSFKGEIDEVTLWERALDEDEVYRLRHITKEQEVQNDPDLIAYYQFNRIDGGSTILDNGGSYHGALTANATIGQSSVPVGSGKATILELSDSQYSYNFIDSETDIYLSNCDSPQGKMVVTRIESTPDTLPSGTVAADDYWVINHYGASMPSLDSIKLTPSNSDFQNAVPNPLQSTFFIRDENAEGYSWEEKSHGIEYQGNALYFDRSINISSAVQIGLTNYSGDFDIIDPGNPCDVDTIPGKSAILPGNGGDYLAIPPMNLNTNEFTMSAWVRSEGLQNSWAGILFCRGGSTTAGLSAANGDNELRYHWDGGEYGWSSGAYLPQSGWNHVALVISPSTATIYLNGVAYTRNQSHATEAFDAITRIGNDPNSTSRTFQGNIDEVCIWNRALTQNEIRSLRHLTKENEILNDPELIVYLQFNEENGQTYDKSGSKFHTSFNGNTSRENSDVPVGGGNSEIINITSDGLYSSNSTGVDLNFSGGTNPNGEVVITRINLQANVYPGTSPISKSYWVINNYGLNQSFTGLSEISFTDIGNSTPITIASDLNLHNRRSNESGVWVMTSNGDTWNPTIQKISYNTTPNKFGQFIIDNSTGKGWIGIQNQNWDNTANWADGIVPISTDHVIIPGGTPFQPMVNVNGAIKSINLMPGATLYVPLGILFDIQ